MTTPATTPAPTPEAAPAQDARPSPETPTTPETDWKAEAKKWETRAKENKTAADKLAEIEEANKTEAQKQADRLAELERERDQARIEGLRFKVAAKHGISDDDADLFLTGNDEETLAKQAQRLADRETERKKNGNRVPREGSTTPSVEGDDRAFVRDLFAKAE